MPGESIPNARAFVRSFNILLKFCRLYGLDHARSTDQFDVSWNELQEAVRDAGDDGLLLGTSGDQLLLDGVPLELAEAEQGLAESLNSAGVSSISFRPNVRREEFANLVRILADTGSKAGPLSERLEQYFGKGHPSRIIVNAVRFAAEDTSSSEARMTTELAELYNTAANQKLQDALTQIGQQLCAEKDPERQTLLSGTFVRLSQEAAQQRNYRAIQQSLDSLADLDELRPAWVQSLRPRIGVENRLSDFIEEALMAETMPDGLTGVLMRVPESAAEQLAVRLVRAGRRSERERVMNLAKAVGNACPRHLIEVLKSEPAGKAASVVGLLSRLDAVALENLLPQRLRNSTRSFHDAVVRQLAIAGAKERGRLLADFLELIDPMVLPLALDEIGMCGDSQTAPKLLRLADGEVLPQASDFLRVKAIEALGRMRAPAATGHLRRFVETRKSFGWAYPEEIRTAAAQALEKLDPEWVRENLPRLGLNEKVLAIAPLDPAPDRDVVRHRRYRRIRLPRNVPAIITSSHGKYSSAISVLSLDGGLLSGDIHLAVGTEATLKIPAGLRSISMRAVVRYVRPQQAGFEMVGMKLNDRAKLRRLLVSLGGDATQAQGSAESH